MTPQRIIIARPETLSQQQQNVQHPTNALTTPPKFGLFVVMTACQMEMALAVKECTLSDPEAKTYLVDEWVSMEENEQCNNLLAAQIIEESINRG
jgi:hypothetical protein